MNKRIRIRQFFMFLLAIVMITARPLTSFAAEDQVTAAKKGVVEINLDYIDENGDEYVITTGSGFLIDDHYAVTLAHILKPDDDVLEMYAEVFEIDEDTLLDRIIIKVCANERSTEASVYTSDYDTDLAVLRLDSSISGCKALPILSSSTLTSSDDCYSLGYSSSVTQYSDPSEVITHHGVFKRIETLDGVEYVVSSTDLSSGNAGGPLVDENGSVIGVLAGQMADNSDNMECYAISSDSLMDILDQSGTPYRNAGGGNNGYDDPADPGSEFPSWGGAAPGGFKRLP